MGFGTRINNFRIGSNMTILHKGSLGKLGVEWQMLRRERSDKKAAIRT